MLFDIDSEIILQKVSDDKSYIHPNERNQPLSVWMKPMNEQNDQSVVFVRVKSLANGDGPRIDVAIPRRQWSSLKIKHPIIKILFRLRLLRKIALEIGRTKKFEKAEFVLYVKVGDAKQIETPFQEAKENLRFS